MWIVFIIGAIQSSFSKSGDRDDKKWARKKLRGDQRAFEKLVKKYEKPIYFLVRKLGLNHDDTDDVVQETFVKAYTSLNQYDDAYPFFPWLHRIAVNTTINKQKQNTRRRITGSSRFLGGKAECPQKEVTKSYRLLIWQ